MTDDRKIIPFHPARARRTRLLRAVTFSERRGQWPLSRGRDQSGLSARFAMGLVLFTLLVFVTVQMLLRDP